MWLVMISKYKKVIGLVLVILLITVLLFYAFYPKNMAIAGYVSTDVRYISSDESGRLLELNAGEGQSVKEGDSLFLLDSSNNRKLLASNDFLRDAILAIKQNLSKGKRAPYLEKTTADIISADAKLEAAKLEYQRQQHLLEFDSTSEREYELAYSQYVQAREQAKALDIMQTINTMPAREDLIIATEKMSKAIQSNSAYLQSKVDAADVKAYESGSVYQIFFRKGEMVRAYSPVMTIINSNDVYIIFYISQENLNKIHLNQLITFETTAGDKLKAEIYFIAQKAEYTPPLLYGINSDSEISFEVKARVKYQSESSTIHIGEPVKIWL